MEGIFIAYLFFVVKVETAVISYSKCMCVFTKMI